MKQMDKIKKSWKERMMSRGLYWYYIKLAVVCSMNLPLY